MQLATAQSPHLPVRDIKTKILDKSPGFDTIILSWSHVNVNASGTCILVSKTVYDDEMTASSKGSNCLNAENACPNHGIWILTLILTICLRSEMKIPSSSCAVIAYPSSMISWISLDMMRILGTWSMNCSLIMINVCVYCPFLEI